MYKKSKHIISEKSDTLEEIYLKIPEALPDAILVTNDEGKIVVFNKEAEFLFGYHRSEIIGEKVEILIPEDLRTVHVIERSKYIEKPIIRESTVVNGLHKSGRLLAVDIRLSPMIIARAGIHILAVIRLFDMLPKILKIKKDIDQLKEEL